MSAGFVFNYLLLPGFASLLVFILRPRRFSWLLSCYSAFFFSFHPLQFGLCLFCARISSYLVSSHAVPWPFIVGGTVEIRGV